MKQKINIFNIIIGVLVLFGTLISAYLLYNLSSNLEKASTRIDMQGIEEAGTVLYRIYWIIGLTLLAGSITAIRLLNLSKSLKSNNAISNSPIASENTNSEAISAESETQKKNLKSTIREIRQHAAGFQDHEQMYQRLLSKLCMKLEASQGLIYEVKKMKRGTYLEAIATFAFKLPENKPFTIDLDEGLVGQVAKSGKKMNVDNIPEDYIKISSGLGSSSPNNLAIIPVLQDDRVRFVAEIASFKKFSADDEKIIRKALREEAKPTKVSTNDIRKDNQKKKRITASM